MVGGTYHVKVHVEADLLELSRAEVLDVVLGAEETELLSGPPTEADGVVNAEVGEGLGDSQEANAAGAVVVDTWAGIDGVGVSAEHDDVASVTALCLGNDVPAR